MNLRKEIKQAYDQIHVSEDFTERLKQELYQKDSHEDEFSEFFQVEEVPKKHPGRYLSFIAASVILSISIGVSMWNMLDHRAEEVFQPAATIPVERSEEPTEETTTTASIVNEYLKRER